MEWANFASERVHRGIWPTTELTLLERIRNHQDSVSWREFIDIYGSLVIKYCCRRGFHEEDARDVAQDVMIQVSNAMPHFCYDPKRGPFRNWLGTIVHRTMLKHLQRNHRIKSRFTPPTRHFALCAENWQSIGDVWMEVFAAHVYRTATARVRLHFDEQTWDAFQQTFAVGKPADEVAKALNQSVGWVYQAKSKVVRRLKQEVLFLAEDSALVEFVRSELHGVEP